MYLTCHPSDIPTNPTDRAIRVSSASMGKMIYDLRDAEVRYPIMRPMLGQNGHLAKIGTVAPVLWRLARLLPFVEETAI